MTNRTSYQFTSESVGEGHPDKVCDIISDAVLDEALRQDPESRVACECFASTGMVLVGGEVTTSGYIDIIRIAKEVLKDIGYDNHEYGIDHNSFSVLSAIKPQSQDISSAVTADSSLNKKQGAGDQGIMFGYACRETPELMPAAIQFSHQIMRRAAEVRKKGILDFLRPDAKCQVTVEYRNGKVDHISTVVLSHQHHDGIPQRTIEEGLIEEVIRKSGIQAGLLGEGTRYLINPSGRFVTGGPEGDAGLTGRKIIVDTYGGAAPHGGGAFSGKDPSKVDRSGAYMARYVAKNLVAAGIADRCQVQVAYAIGIAEPVSLFIDTFGTSTVEEPVLESLVRNLFDLTPEGIIRKLDLKRPIYRDTAVYGHFGRDEFPWERTDMAGTLKDRCSALS
ncbi:MAG: methionine adenosyltransferase [Sphaerochaetaceae bacterium]|nr:methionine adenosyltransferase [Sphaerochaetaceae bacterium]